MQVKLASNNFSVLINQRVYCHSAVPVLSGGELRSSKAGACSVVCLSHHWCWETNSIKFTQTEKDHNCFSENCFCVCIVLCVWSTLSRCPEVWHLRALHVLVVGCNLYFITATNKVSSFIRIVITNLHRNQSLHEWDDIDGQDNYWVVQQSELENNNSDRTLYKLITPANPGDRECWRRLWYLYWEQTGWAQLTGQRRVWALQCQTNYFPTSRGATALAAMFSSSSRVVGLRRKWRLWQVERMTGRWMDWWRGDILL